MVALRFFSDSEFKRACPACSLSDMAEEFMLKLDSARALAGVPFKVNSAYRSVEYEKQKGRSGTSSHCSGCAADIACSNSATRLRIVRAAIAVGFSRIGIHKHFIHLDFDPSKISGIWLY